MKLYHGSPKKLRVIKPKLAKGIDDFENQKAVFLCKSFHQAALYAIGKTLKGRAVFAVTPRRLLIAGKLNPKRGYVYLVDAKKFQKGRMGQYTARSKLKPLFCYFINPDNYSKSIIHLKNKEEIIKKLKINN